MIPTAITKIRWLRMMDIKSCKNNCKCANRLQIILTKTLTINPTMAFCILDVTKASITLILK